MGLQQVTNKVATQNATQAKSDKGVENALKADNNSLEAVHKAITSSGLMTVKSIDKLGNILIGNELQKLEDQQEMIDLLKGLKPEKSKEGVKNAKFNESPKGIFDWLKNILGGLSSIPIIKWFTNGIKALWTTLVETIAPALVGAGGFLLGFLGGFFKQHGLDFEKAFIAIKNGILNLFPDFLKVGKEDGIIAKAISKFDNALMSVKALFKEEGVFVKIGSYFTRLKGTFSKFFKLGETFGKIFAPIEAVYYTIMGAFDEWKKVADEGVGTQILGAIKGAGKGALEWLLSLPATLIDLVKDWVISPIINFFGGAEIAKQLKSFSVADFAKEFVNEFFGFFTKIGDFIGDYIVKIVNIFSWDDKKSLFDNVLGIFANLATMPERNLAMLGDFIKDIIVTPILQMFGADNLVKMLKEVSLVDTFQKVIDTVLGVFKNIKDYVFNRGKELIKFMGFTKDDDSELSKLDKLKKSQGDKLVSQLKDDEFKKSNNLSDDEASQMRLSLLRQKATDITPIANNSGADMNATKMDTLNAQASAPIVVSMQGGNNTAAPSTNVSSTQINVASSNHPNTALSVFSPAHA